MNKFCCEQFERRFWRFAFPEPNSGCWLWIGYVRPDGYGSFMLGSRLDGSRQMKRAHRAAYEYFVGRIPNNLELDHVCRNRCCVNPDHLEAVARSVNVRRGASAAARKLRALKQTHCKNGHPFIDENTNRWHGWRQCIVCRNIRIWRERGLPKWGKNVEIAKKYREQGLL